MCQGDGSSDNFCTKSCQKNRPLDTQPLLDTEPKKGRRPKNHFSVRQPLQPLHSNFNIVLDQIPESAAAAFSKEINPVVLIRVRIDISRHHIASSVNEDLNGADIKEHMKVDAVLYTDPADPAVDILLRPGERNTALFSVKNNLPRLFVIIDQRLMFLSAE